tara:strand:+ start:301 stop:810 length:510 start_codon:yes stop_codon:yes gene_type:complete
LLHNKKIDFNLIRYWFESIDATKGIGEDLFLSISQLTPMLNVDLLIRSQDKTSTLLTWRSDNFYGPGWHVPGGIVRFKETMLERVKKVALHELKSTLDNISEPIGHHEMFNNTRDIRGHFVSFVYECTLKTNPPEELKAQKIKKDGQWRWFKSCPDNLIINQKALKKYL